MKFESTSDKLDYFKVRLKHDREYLEYATTIAVQQRLFIVWCLLSGIPVKDLILSSNQMLEGISKLRDCIEDMDKNIRLLDLLTSCDRDYISKQAILHEALEDMRKENETKPSTHIVTALEKALLHNVDQLYQSGDEKKYNETVEHIKAQGIRVLRNSKGKHRIELV